MSATLDVVQAIVTDLISLGSLVGAVAAWRFHRPQGGGEARIECGGVTVTLASNDPAEIARVVAALSQTPSDQS
jgi:hypothetical protein